MKKRIVATILWFASGWYVGALGAYLLDLSPALAAILGTAAAAIVGLDPRGIIWGGAPRAARSTVPTVRSAVTPV